MAEKKTTSLWPVYAAYYLILCVMLVASFFPQYRVWGFNHWAYYPLYVPIGLFLIGVLVPVVLSIVHRKSIGESAVGKDDTRRDAKFFIWMAILIVGYMVAFYFLRASKHYLGDGYQLLANIGTVNPWVKVRNLGEELVHKLVFNMLSGEDSARALQSFQLVSYFSGLLFLTSVAFSAKQLFDRNLQRILFFLGLASAGYMLLFFGYVENYSLFVTMVMVYALTGLLVVRRKLNRWYLLIPLILAIAMHVFGVVLIPSAGYLLMAGTPAGDALKRLSLKARVAITALVLITGAAVFAYFYTNHYFFRFAFVPLVQNRFTIENYTLFSIKHLLDILNLSFVLLPSFLVFILVFLSRLPNRGSIRHDTVFLGILLASGLGVVFLFDPKLGMPRDWDLFSFFGVPAALICFYTLLMSRRESNHNFQIAVMAVLLGAIVLFPRVVGRSLTDNETWHAENYIRLDLINNKNLIWILREYHELRGDTARAREIDEQWHRAFPERPFMLQGEAKKDSGETAEAKEYFQTAIQKNPTQPWSYERLAMCYRYLGQYDSAVAVLRIADGLNPNSTYIMFEFGKVYRELGEFEKAERYLRRAIDIDKSNLDAYLWLLELYWTSEQIEEHDLLLIEAAAHPNAPAGVHKRLGDNLFEQHMYREAQTHYKKALEKGLDSVLVRDVYERIAKLKSQNPIVSPASDTGQH